jgi:hypothetical protein
MPSKILSAQHQNVDRAGARDRAGLRALARVITPWWRRAARLLFRSESTWKGPAMPEQKAELALMVVRIEPEYREAIEAAAKEARRSISAEIALRLQQSLPEVRAR